MVVIYPAWLGFHPWFARDLERGGSAEIEFDATEMLIRGSDGIPTGKRSAPTQPPWDDAFTGIKGTPAVVWEDVARISIECDAPWWVVYSEDSLMAYVLSHRPHHLMRRT